MSKQQERVRKMSNPQVGQGKKFTPAPFTRGGNRKGPMGRDRAQQTLSGKQEKGGSNQRKGGQEGGGLENQHERKRM